jgi:CDP-glucose 4,6-dehydratase
LHLTDSVIKRGSRGAWNFGPEKDSCKSVGEVVEIAKEFWGGSADWNHIPDENAPHEDGYLVLDSTKAERGLDWKNHLSLRQAISNTVDWERRASVDSNTLVVSRQSIQSFLIQAQ